MLITFRAKLGQSLILIGLNSQEESVRLTSLLQEIICFLGTQPVTLLNISYNKTKTIIFENLSWELFQ